MDSFNKDDDYAKDMKNTLAIILNKKNKNKDTPECYKEEMDKNNKLKKEKLHKMNQYKEDSQNAKIDVNKINNFNGSSPKRSKRISEKRSTLQQPFKTRETNKNKKNKKNQRQKARHKYEKWQNEQIPLQDSKGICVFYLQGKCNKDDCLFSHDAIPPLKLELCKFYLLDNCSKGDNCSYLHSEFPCKFYHMGLNCTQGDNCKYAHGKPLSESLKQILFKTMDTASCEILKDNPNGNGEG